MNRTIQLSDCWAKTDEQGRPALTVRDHCLNVGSVGQKILTHLPECTASLPPVSSPILVAGHDIGKISPGFLLKSTNWREQWQKALNLEAPQTYEGRHAILSQKIFADHADKSSLWLMAVGGHHGLYFCNRARPVIASLDEADPWLPAFRQELLDELIRTFGPLNTEEQIEKGARLHWFTGLMIFSDWIGSNTTWFPLSLTPVKISDAQKCAETALAEIGWHKREVKPCLGFPELFELSQPRPLQETLLDVVNEPGLYIVEAPMGEGKTEAALAAAYRRWTEGGERGLYFALPTQLTSNRIHERVQQFLSRSVADNSSLALVHGSAWLKDRKIHPLKPTLPRANNHDEEFDPAMQANRWFSDSRRAMLAPFGVGTIDQALMAVLPVKFSALRLFALGGKVVVIDEVHSYDPYTSALVDRAVQWLLEIKCTVIILSATLTAARRAALVRAAGSIENNHLDSYPLITKVDSKSKITVAVPIPGPPAPKKGVIVDTLSSNIDEWMRAASQAAESGACVLIIRNTIELARKTHDILKSRCREGIQFGLIHSRFTQVDRDRNENLWMEWLGKDQCKRPLHGAILIGTQVLEQSVDIDADLLITDLAPTDLILQRLGRLHRHQRPRPSGFEIPRCIILRPSVDWNADAKTLNDQLKPHRFIYPAFTLYMADRVWSERKSINLPDEIRPVLEASHKVPGDLPNGVAELYQALLKKIREMEGTAWMNGVFNQASVDDVEGSQTRWRMQPTAHIILLEGNPTSKDHEISVGFPSGKLVRFTDGLFDFPLARELHLHAIRVPRYLVKDMFAHQPGWLHQHCQDSVIMAHNEFGHCRPCHGPDPAAFSFTYSNQTGLGHERNQGVPFDFNEEDESWF